MKIANWRATKRTLGQALAISLALHAILLWQDISSLVSGQARMQAAPQAPALNAVLRTDVIALPVAPSAEPIAPKSLAADSQVSPIQSIRRRPESPNALTTASQSTAQPSIPTAASFATIAETEATTTPTLTDSTGLDANGLREYRVSLAVAARRFRSFPAEALAGGWTGTAEVRLDITPEGLPQPPQLQHPSGHEILDAAALDMIGSAAQSISVPTSLRGKSFSIQLPVEFGSRAE